MLAVPEEIKDLFRGDNSREETRRKWKLRFFDSEIKLIFPEDMLFPSDDLFPIDQKHLCIIENNQMVTESVLLTESLCEAEDLIWGECNASQFEVTIADILLDLTGKEFMVTVEVADYEMAMGIYTVDSFVRQSDRRLKKITAYDRMRKFQTDVAGWYQGLEFPLSLKAFRNSLCSYVGIVQLDIDLPLDGMVVTKTIDPEQLPGLDALQAICEINGCFGHIDKTGRLRYQYLPASSLFPSEELFPDEDLFPIGMNTDESETLAYYKQTETSYEDYTVTAIDRLQIRQEEGDVGASYPKEEGGNTYVIEGNFLAYGKSTDELIEIASVAYSNISGRIYRPCKIVAPALPWLEVGDGIVCYTTDDVIETYCLKRTMRGIQATMDTYEAAGNVKYEENFGIQSQITQLEGKAAVIKKSVEEVSVDVSDLKESTEAKLSIMANEISAEVERATDTENKLSASIKINAEQIALKVSQGDVTEELNSELKITGNAISLTTGHFTITSKNLTVDSSGNAIFSGDVKGASFTGGSINIGNGKFVVDSSGKVTAKNALIEGATINGAELVTGTAIVARDTLEGNVCSFEDVSAQTIWCPGTVYGGAWEYISDRRNKRHIKSICPEDCFKIITKLNPVSYELFDSNISGVGFIAQDVQKVMSDLGYEYPLVGYRKKDDVYTIPYGNYVAIVVGAIQYLAGIK